LKARIQIIALLLVFLFSACNPIISIKGEINHSTIAISKNQENAQTESTGDSVSDLPVLSIDEKANQLISKMTLEEKIGQMTQVEYKSSKPGDIERYFIGSILSGGRGSLIINNSNEYLDCY